RLAGYKLIATTIQPSGLLSGRLAKTLLSETLLGSPLLLESSGTWAALELFDIASDPAERRNLLNGDLPVSELLSIMPGLATATVPTSTGERPISAFLPHHPSC